MRLRDLRLGRRLSQQQVAERAGISTNTYQLFESGRSRRDTDFNPTLDTLLCLADALETTLVELLDIDAAVAYDSHEDHAGDMPRSKSPSTHRV